MNPTKRRWINKQAEAIHNALELSIPVDMQGAVAKLEGKLEFVSDLEAGVDGRIQKDGENSFVIHIPITQYGTRQRFSIAHELGHLFLHMGFLIQPEKWRQEGEYVDSIYHRYGHSIEEYEANEFAAAFLMPAELFDRVAEKHTNEKGFTQLPEVARYFNVSKEAVRNRGRWLGIFSWD